MTKKKLFSKSAKDKNVHVSPDKPGKSSFFKSPKLVAVLFAVAFGTIGGIYLLSSKAAPAGQFDLKISAVSTSGQGLNGVNIATTGCTPSSATINGSQNFTCYYASAVTSITAGGYHVSPSSQIKVGSVPLVGLSLQPGTLNKWAATITMEANQPSPAPAAAPAPTPAPAPAAAPAPAPTAKSSSSSSSSRATTTTARASTPAATSAPAATPTEEVADTSTDSTNEEQLDSGFTTNVPEGKTATLTSYDDQVKVSFPKGAFDTDAYCSIDTGDSENVPVKSEDLIGPYGLNCVDSEGNTLDELKEAVTVSFALPSDKTTYVAYTHDDTWTEAARGKGKTLGVKLSKQELFAAAPAKTTNWLSIIIDIVAIIVALLVIAGIVHLIRRRRQQDSVPTTTAEEYYQDYMSAQGQGEQPPSGQDQGQNPGAPPPGPPNPPGPTPTA